MAVVTVCISNDLRVPRSELPPGLEDEIIEFLSVPNGDKERALELGQWGADELPDFISLWRVENGDLVLPRGFAALLRGGVEGKGHSLVWRDETSAKAMPLALSAGLNPIHLDQLQEQAVRRMFEVRQGIWQAPTGLGKTIAALEFFRRSGLRCLVLVDKVGIAEQWREQARRHLGFEAGLIGDSVDDERALTIAMVQTLYRQRQRDLSGYGVAIADEAHHVQADSWRSVIERLRARYLIGVTATPLEGDWRRSLLEAIIGPVFHETELDDARRGGRVIKPVIEVVRTDFRWRPRGRETSLKDTRVIYKRVIDQLLRSGPRNELIVQRLMANPGSCQLVASDRLYHLTLLQRKLFEHGWPEECVLVLTGAESRQERAEIQRRADEGDCIIFSTISKEALDIPRLDRLHMVWPLRRRLPVRQLVGRVERAHPRKHGAIVFDYADLGDKMLRAQFFARLRDVYRPDKYTVVGSWSTSGDE